MTLSLGHSRQRRLVTWLDRLHLILSDPEGGTEFPTFPPASQTLVVGASKEESSKSAMILILLAQETPRADAPEKGSADTRAVEKRP